PSVRGHNTRPDGRREVDSAVRRTPLTVDDPPRPESASGLGAFHWPHESIEPEPFTADGPVKRPESVALVRGTPLRRRIEIDHAAGDGEVLDRIAASRDVQAALRGHDASTCSRGHGPGSRSRRTIHVQTEDGRGALGEGEHGKRMAPENSLDRGASLEAPY